jgi:hypothetical protein
VIRRALNTLPLVASAAGGAYAAGILLGHLYAWAEPRLADWTANRRNGGGAR